MGRIARPPSYIQFNKVAPPATSPQKLIFAATRTWRGSKAAAIAPKEALSAVAFGNPKFG
jgi:hypothetical protein